MRKTLQSFIEKTATSRDANEFLLRYSRVEDAEFLLLLVEIHTPEELKDLCLQIDDLLGLDLIPTLWLHPELCSKDFILDLEKRYRNQDFLWMHEAESSWLTSLQADLEERSFFKILWSGGALKNKDGKEINQVHLSHDQVEWDEESKKALAWIRPLLESRGPSISLQCVAPHLVMPELFTRKGSGTLVSQGYFFEWVEKSELDVPRMKRLIEVGFGRELKADYFENLPQGTQVIHEKEFRGGMVLLPADGFSYLDKVVVEPQFLGRGMGSLLLDELMANLHHLGQESLAWRARTDNPYLSRYAQVIYAHGLRNPLECGTLSDGRYIYHFLGVAPESLRKVVTWMSNHCSSFVGD